MHVSLAGWVFTAMQLFSSCGEQAALAERGLQGAQASELQHVGSAVVTSGFRAQAQPLWCTDSALRSTWDPPRPGVEPASPALAGGLLTTESPEKPEE